MANHIGTNTILSNGASNGNNGGGDSCCIIQRLCWDDEDPKYNPCGVDADLKIKANFTEGVPTLTDAGIIITAHNIINPNPTTVASDTTSYHVTDVFGNFTTANTPAYFAYADLMNTEFRKFNVPDYTIAIKKKNADTYTFKVTGCAPDEMGLHLQTGGDFLVLVRNIVSIQAIPKRVVLYFDAISNIVSKGNNFTFDYYLPISGSPAVNYWVEETRYKILNKAKYFTGNFKKEFYIRGVANEPISLVFERNISFEKDCAPKRIRKKVTVTSAKYPYDVKDVLVTYPISLNVENI